MKVEKHRIDRIGIVWFRGLQILYVLDPHIQPDLAYKAGGLKNFF